MARDPSKDALLKEALARFKVASDAEADQREREVEDLKFVDFEQQWPDDVKNARAGSTQGIGGLPPVPPRPCLTINKLRVPVEQISTEARQARLSLQFSPKGSGATRETAEAFEDIARGIQVESRAHLARQWAFERAIKCGRGFYRILTEYANDGDFDQDIVYKRILNQAAVYLDPAATEPDWSDGEWAFVVEDMPLDRYQRLFPNSKLAGMADDPGTFQSIGDDQPDWVSSSETGAKVVRVAEYFHVEYEKTQIGVYTMPDGSERTLDADSVPEGAQPVLDGDTQAPLVRDVTKRRVKWCKVNAVEVLERQDWPGRYIPIVPVIAAESNANGERRWTGIVRPAMDAQRSYNYMASAEAESVGLAPRAPFIGYMETVEPYLAWWSQANTRNFPVLPIAAVRGPNGETLPPPQRSVVEPAIQAIVIAKQGADGDIKATTGRWDASLGAMTPSERSGKAILALQKQAEQGSSGWLDNLASMSMVYEGKILRDLIPKVYGRPGRVIAAIGADERQRAVMVNAPFTMQNGQPQAAPPGTPGAKFYDLQAGEYSVAVTIGKSFTTRREEAVAMMGQLAEAVPQMVPAYADVWVENMDFPGARQIADRLKKQLPPQLQEDDKTQPIPPQLQQQMQQAQQMIEMLSKELDAKNDLIEKEQARIEADLEKARLDSQTKLEIASLQSQTQLELEKMKAEATSMQATLDVQKAELTYLQTYNQMQLEQAHAREMKQIDVDAAREQSAQEAAQQQMLAGQQGQQQMALQGAKGEQSLLQQQMAGDQSLQQQQMAQQAQETE